MYETQNCEIVNQILENPTSFNTGALKAHLYASKIRILMAKLGEGYDEALMTLSLAFRDAGYEVIYTDIQKPEAIVASAIQECVDHIGITTLPGADIADLAKVVELLTKEDSSHIKVTAGGYLERNKIPEVKEMGIVEFFPLGSTIPELIQWARENIKPTEK